LLQTVQNQLLRNSLKFVFITAAIAS